MQDTTPGRWTRRGLFGIPIVGWVLFAVGGIAVAIVGFVVTLGMSGSVTTPDGIDVEYVTGIPEYPVAGGWAAGSVPPDCSVGAVTATDFPVNAIGYPNSECYFEVAVLNNGPSEAVLQRVGHGLQGSGQGVDVALRGTTGFGSDYDWCGTVIPPDGSPVVVGFTMTFSNELQPNIDYTMGGEDGLTFVPTGAYVDEDCS